MNWKSFVPSWGCLTAAILALAVVFPFRAVPAKHAAVHALQMQITSDTPGIAELFFDVGRGYNATDCSSVPFVGGGVARTYSFPLPLAGLRVLRFDPINGPGRVMLSHVRVVDNAGTIEHEFVPEDFEAAYHVTRLEVAGDAVTATTLPPEYDPILTVRLPSRLKGRMAPLSEEQRFGVRWLMVFIALLALFAVVRRWLTTALQRLKRALGDRPVATLALAAAVAVGVQCHPLIFFERSLVSPDNASYLLYDDFPTLPGYRTTELEDAKGSDVGAMMYHHLYFPRMQRDAVFRDGELPLWNRHTMCGLPQLGQGQTMFGEALNMIPLLAGGAAWSWDLKFVLARWLYAFGLGVAVWLITRHLASAGITALSGAFVGFFAYKINHALQFSVALAPWILVAWLVLRASATRRQLALAALALLVANWEVFTSGTIKEASMLMVGLNLAGALAIVLDCAPWRERGARLAHAAGAGVVFVLVTAPFWMTFLKSLQVSTSSYAQPIAVQIPLWQFAGFFEDLLYRQHMPGEAHMLPSANFVILAGVLWALVRVRDLAANRTALAVALAALLPLALAFGVIPATWIIKVPFVANIHHVNNTFSCVLLVLGSVVAGCGLHLLVRRIDQPRWWLDGLLVAVGVSALVGIFLGRSLDQKWSPFFRAYLPSLLLGLVAAHCALLAWRRRRDAGVLVTGVALVLGVLLWRHGMYLHSPFDPYVVNPKVRADFQAPSPAVEFVSARLGEPSRPNGIRYNLFSGFGATYGWESIYGVDPLRNPRFDELMRAGRVLKLFWCLNVPASDQWFEENTGTLQPMLDLLGVRYYLASPGTPAERMGGLQPLGKFDLDVYESPTVWPRAFFVDRLETYRSVDELVQRVNGTADRRPFAATTAADVADLLLPVNAATDDAARTVSAARDYHLTTNTSSFTIDATGPGVVVVMESDSGQDFRATINGQPVPYFRVNHVFKAVAVPAAGTYTVKFSYWPAYLNLSLVLAASGLLLGVAGFWWSWRAHVRAALDALPARR